MVRGKTLSPVLPEGGQALVWTLQTATQPRVKGGEYRQLHMGLDWESNCGFHQVLDSGP